MRYSGRPFQALSGAAAVCLLALSIPAGVMAARDEAGDDCFPPCRSGYLCHEGECIEACNPPCPEGERCTDEGECVPAPSAAPKPAPEPAPKPAPKPAPESAPEPEPAPAPEPREVFGGIVGIGGMASFCASSNGCDTGDKDVGFGGYLTGGYAVLPWLSIDLVANFTYLKLERENDPESFFLSLVAGATFTPTKRERVVDPVLGLHLGYALERSWWEDTAGPFVSRSHGLALQYTVGLDFNFSRVVTMGLHLVIREPIHITSCVDSTIDQSTGIGTGTVDSTRDSYCASYEGERDQFYFDPVLDLRFYF